MWLAPSSREKNVVFVVGSEILVEEWKVEKKAKRAEGSGGRDGKKTQVPGEKVRR